MHALLKKTSDNDIQLLEVSCMHALLKKTSDNDIQLLEVSCMHALLKKTSDKISHTPDEISRLTKSTGDSLILSRFTFTGESIISIASCWLEPPPNTRTAVNLISTCTDYFIEMLTRVSLGLS